MKNTKILAFLLALVTFLSAYLRFNNLSGLPPALFSDEVDVAYQSFVFSKTGADYYGNKLPTHFHSFSDWRTPFQIYSTLPFTAINLPTELAVRLPSAIFGVLTVIAFFFLIKIITNNPAVALVASTLLSISPWHIHYSRTGFEVSGMLLFLILGFYFWFKYLSSKNNTHLIFSIVSLLMSPYFYSTSKMFIPLIGLLFIILWPKVIVKLKASTVLLSILTIVIISFPLIKDTIKGTAGFRFSYINIFSQPFLEDKVDKARYEDIFTSHLNEVGVSTPIWSKLLHNKYQIIFQDFSNNYFSSFSPEFLIFHGDSNLRHGFGGHGLIYTFEAILVLIGIFVTLKSKKPSGIFFVLLLVLSPIPYSLTRDSISPHSTRLILMLPSLIYLAAQGLSYIFSKLNTRIAIIPIILIYALSFSVFWDYYTNHYPQESARSWHVGMKEAVLESFKLHENKPIYYSSKYEPFLPFFLAYTNYLPSAANPASTITHLQNEYFDGLTINNQYYFGNLNISNLPTNSVIVVPSEQAKEFTNKPVKVVTKKYINQEEFYIYEL